MLQFIPDTHQYLYEGREIPSVTGILQAEGFIDTTWYDDWSRERGKMVHRATELYDLDDLDEEGLDEALVPYLEAWKRFLRESGFQILEMEHKVYSPSLQYAGTLDRLGGLPEHKPAIIDVKSGAVEPWVAIQLAAYAMTYPDYYGIERYAIQLKSDGKYSLKQFRDMNDFGIWRAAVSCYHWKNNNLKRRS